MVKFVKLSTYSISSRGIFLLVRNESSRVVKTDEIKTNIAITTTKVENGSTKESKEEFDVLGIDFPNKISKTYLKRGDVIGVQIKTS